MFLIMSMQCLKEAELCMFRPAKPKPKQDKNPDEEIKREQKVQPLPQVVTPPAIMRRGTGIQVTTPPITDHSLLSNLLVDKHTLYALADKTRPSPWVAETDVPVLTNAKYPNALLLDGSRKMTGTLITRNVEPDVTATYALGAGGKRYATAYINSVYSVDTYAGTLYASIRCRTNTIDEYSPGAGVSIGGDMLSGSPEVYSIGSDSKPWLRGFWQGRNTVLDSLGKLIVGGKFPTGHPLFTGEEAVPYIDFYCEYPIGTKTARYIISNYYGSLTFSGISADELTQIAMMTFDFPSSTFVAGAHFQPAYEGLDLGSPLHPVFPVRWRDVGIQRYTFLGKTENGLPTADETMRGVMIRLEGATGVADKLYCCMKKADNTYAWIQVASG